MRLLLLTASLARADDELAVQLAVQVRGAPAGTELWASTTWLGEDRTLRLTDDGSVAGDLVGDDVYAGHWSGSAVRVLPVRLTARSSTGAVTTLGVFNEVLGIGETELAYAVEMGTPHSVRRVALGGSSRAAEVSDLVRVSAGIGWAGVVLAYVAWLVGRTPARS
ncbi:MAG: hypothetical protein EXR71_00185 [Myxococcales bacterium]|nr:hypothetical protein [Myxococcales bacterium]